MTDQEPNYKHMQDFLIMEFSIKGARRELAKLVTLLDGLERRCREIQKEAQEELRQPTQSLEPAKVQEDGSKPSP